MPLVDLCLSRSRCIVLLHPSRRHRKGGSRGSALMDVPKLRIHLSVGLSVIYILVHREREIVSEICVSKLAPGRGTEAPPSS